ncbi:MAG: hypothetical protein ACOX7J_02160 [Bacillota bacterium]|jgi:hypothetical protein
MALSNVEKELVELFRIMKDDGRFEDKAVLPIMAMLSTDDMKMRLMEYMFACDDSGKPLTQVMVVKEACRIYAEENPQIMENEKTDKPSDSDV